MEIMYSQYVQDSFEIYISTPPSFTSNSSYNIVYYCDANLKSGHHLQSLISTDQYNKSLGQVIFVGIGHIGNYHVLRRRDFILPEINGKDTMGRDKNYGQIEKFYLFLKYELMASINQRFKVNLNSNSIIGHSLGGLFVFFCLFQADSLFARYFALSPALWIDNYSIYKFNKIKEGFTGEKYLFFAAGSKETVNKILHGTNEAKEFLDRKSYMNLTYEYKILKDETHNSEVPISLKEILDTKL
jgi:predicted alpha/beta superfamily hydrolase